MGGFLWIWGGGERNWTTYVPISFAGGAREKRPRGLGEVRERYGALGYPSLFSAEELPC